MPLGPGVRYRYKPGTKIRLAFRGNKVVEAKNMATGKTHTPADFAEATPQGPARRREEGAEGVLTCLTIPFRSKTRRARRSAGSQRRRPAQCVELDFFEKIVALAREYGIWVVHDLAYADITFDGWKAPSIMQVPGARDVPVDFFTMSKSYNMAGWRIGFMVGNRDLVAALARIKGYHDYGTFTPIQVAAIAGLEGPQECVAEIAMKYQKRRDVLVKGLHEAGWMVDNPKASMYVWARIPEPYRPHGSLEFTKKLLAHLPKGNRLCHSC